MFHPPQKLDITSKLFSIDQYVGRYNGYRMEDIVEYRLESKKVDLLDQLVRNIKAGNFTEDSLHSKLRRFLSGEKKFTFINPYKTIRQTIPMLICTELLCHAIAANCRPAVECLLSNEKFRDFLKDDGFNQKYGETERNLGFFRDCCHIKFQETFEQLHKNSSIKQVDIEEIMQSYESSPGYKR